MNLGKMMGYCIIFWKRCEFTYGIYHLPQFPLHSRPRPGGQSSLRARLSRVVEGGGMGVLQVPLFPESTGEFHSLMAVKNPHPLRQTDRGATQAAG